MGSGVWYRPGTGELGTVPCRPWKEFIAGVAADRSSNCDLFPFAGDSGITKHEDDFVHSHFSADR